MVKMSDVNKDIGMRIRELRELSDITTEEVRYYNRRNC